MKDFKLALKLLRSAWRAGELRILLVSVVLAVAATSAVGQFAGRVQTALDRQGNLLLGADLRIAAHHTLPPAYETEAERRRLRMAHTMGFPSMVAHGDASALTEIKAVDTGYPLRGQLLVSDSPLAPLRQATSTPASGEVWVDARLAGLLALKAGDLLQVGARSLKVTATLRQEPDRGSDMFSIAPRLMMNLNDVQSTGLIQLGSHVSYHLLVAGDTALVDGLRRWLESRIKPGERLEGVRDARPEVRSALDKTRQFLGLAAMASVVLAMVAMALAAMRFVQRNLDVCAMLRCFGVAQSDILRIYALQLALLGLFGGVLGSIVGYAAQAVLGELAGRFFLEKLPAPDLMPAVYAVAIGLAILFGVVTPHLLQLRDVPALRILRRDVGKPGRLNWLAWVPGIVVAVALVFMHASNARLGGITLLGFCGLLLAACLAAVLMAALLRLCNFSGAWRLGLANLVRRPALGIALVSGFSLALMALLLLTVVREDLFANWHATLPPDAPNRFVINIQPDQVAPLRAFMQREGLPQPAVQPMVRGRLVAINGRQLDLNRYVDERARRLAGREFNLSWSHTLQADNRIVAGRWWGQADAGRPLLSMEQGIAETLDIHLGDRLVYDIGGEKKEVTVASLRKVQWDSMRANFFAIAAPGVLESFPASYITSFHLPAAQEDMLNRMVRAFPSLTIIDITAIMSQVRSIIERMALAVEFVFLFCLVSGLTVLYAALAATQDERMTETALLRVLGASRKQVRNAILAEFALVGLLSGMLATIGASALGYYLGTRVLDVPYVFDPLLLVWGLGASTVLIPAVAWIKLRATLARPPRDVLQSA